ncbi:MAG: family 78 glycoside hydrolase catalytic domain [Eubacteriales bacterium]|nr:family 78 glycoside hydrolase catalytic domain [Eubacteriales bacterium]
MTHEQAFGQAKWIGGDAAASCPVFRAAFDAPQVKQARITICGLGYFYLYVNGRRVSEDLFVPVTSDYVKRPIMENGRPFDEEMGHRCYFLRYELAPFLRPGRNELAVALGDGFFSTFQYSYDQPVRYGQPRLCYRIEWTDEKGMAGEVLSGTDVKWHPGIVAEYNLFKGETQELSRLAPDWTSAPASEGWLPAQLLPEMDTCFQPQDCPADRIVRQIIPRMLRNEDGVRLYDLGENITGWVVLQDQGQAGAEISVEFGEDLNAAGDMDGRFMHGQFFRVISDGRGRTVHPQFTWHGFRYFAVKGAAEVKAVAVIHSDIPVHSGFDSASPVLNWLYQAYLRTQLCNWHGGIPSDCPHLERKGYTGDGQLTCETFMLLLNNKSLTRKWIRDILDCQDRNSGHVQYTAPYSRNGGGPGGWGCAIVMVPWKYYLQYGETDVLQDAYEGMCHYIDYLLAHSDERHLVVSDRPGAWCLGDWCAPTGAHGGSDLPAPFVNNYFLIKSVQVIQQVEDVLGLPHPSRWAGIMENAAKGMNDTYFDPATGDYAGGIEAANAFALDIGLGNEKTFHALKARYEALGRFDTGIFGTEILPRILFERGEAALAFRLLTTQAPISIAGWMKAGATTLWEYWPRAYQRSLSHPMFGAVTKELFYRCLGMRQAEDSAGWEKAVIAPAVPTLLPYAKGQIETPKGILAVSYSFWEGKLTLTVTVPAGMQAEAVYQSKHYPLHTGEQTLTL